ncbi:MAG: M14 family metallopeptidase [Candidatus Eisenbacteria bacterium]
MGAPVSTTPAMPDTAVPIFWRTRAERSGYRLTADYDETLRFCQQMEAGSRWIDYQSYGKSGQGRDLPLLVVSSDRAFTPQAARATGKPIILIQNGIHSGEIEGKDASLALIRDIAVLRKRPELLDQAILLVLPIFSVDAHERRGRHNRINQNGPEEMGWRVTPMGLNLNRDYVKVESPEMRALIANVFTQWWPHLLVDNHTTDGADYRFDVSYGLQHGAGVPEPIDRWHRDAFEGRVLPRVEALGHLVSPYVDFRKGNDPASGMVFGNLPPRFSTAYAVIQNRPAILIETHMIKPYGTRVRATYDLMVALLEEINARPRELTDAVTASEAATVARARATDPTAREVVLASDTASAIVPFLYKGVRTTWERSDITGALVPRYGTAPLDISVPLLRQTRPTVVVRQPAGYLVPQEWTVCRELMDIHGIRYRRFVQAWNDSVEVQRVVRWSPGILAEGHRDTRVHEMALERRRRAYRPGDLWVPLDQPGATLAMHLFEAQAPDGLMKWNAFDTVLEFKEYSEDYVMEPIARRMLAENPALRREFETKLAADSVFARDPAARLDFFYRRSPWADPQQNLHPVARARSAPPERVLEPARP